MRKGAYGMSRVYAVGHGGDLSVSWQRSYYAMRIAAARSAAVNPAQPGRPVEPVSPVRRVAPDAAVRIPITVPEPRVPTESDLDNAANTLARMRVRFPDAAISAVAI